MSPKPLSVFCTLPTWEAVTGVWRELGELGFLAQEQSLLYLESKVAVRPEPGTGDLPLPATEVIDLEGVGRWVVSGAIAPMLKQRGRISVSDSLLDFGVPAVEAALYEQALRGGAFLVAIHSVNADKTDHARKILRAAGAVLVRTLSTVTTPRARILPLPSRPWKPKPVRATS